MFFVRLPLSRQIFTNLLLLIIIAGGFIYITQKNNAILEYKNKTAIVQRSNSYFLFHLEEKKNHQMRDLVANIVYSRPFENIPSDFTYFEWHDDKSTIPVFSKSTDDFIVPEAFLRNYQEAVLTPKPDQTINSLYCNAANSCTYLIHRRYCLGAHSGVAIFAIRADGIISDYKQLLGFTGLIFLEENSPDLNTWKNQPLQKSTHVVSLNISKFNKNGQLPDVLNNNGQKRFTNQDYIDSFASMWNFDRKIYTPIELYGHNFGYLVTFLPNHDIIDVLLLPTPENFLHLFIVFLLLGGMILYQLHVLFQAASFMRTNRDRLKRYAPISTRIRHDETLALLTLLDSAITSAEKRDHTIRKLNRRLSLFDYYDTASGLPNAKWLNEQLQHSISDYTLDNGAIHYLVLFSPSLPMKLLRQPNTLPKLANAISKVIGEGSRLAMFSENTFALITSNCNNNNEVCRMLDEIKQAVTRELSSTDISYHIHAGIVSVISSTISPAELIRRAQTALQCSITDKNKNDNYTLFSEAVANTGLTNSLLETSLRKAKMSGELILKYDFVYNINDKSTAGIMARPCWLRNGTAVSLADYRDDIISCGLNIEYNYWKIENCLFDLNELDNKLSKHLNIIINLNLGQLTDPNLPNMLDMLTMKYSIMPSRIIFSVTEEDISGDPDAALEAINILAESGYNINLADYGRGYADARFIQKYRFSSIVCSPVLSRRLLRTEYDRRMISAAIEQIRALGTVKICAEGADNMLILRTLESIGVVFVNGTLFPHDCLITQIPERIGTINLDDMPM